MSVIFIFANLIYIFLYYKVCSKIIAIDDIKNPTEEKRIMLESLNKKRDILKIAWGIIFIIFMFTVHTGFFF